LERLAQARARVADELEVTKPLSVTMAERIDALRDWAKDRAVFAG